MRQQTMLVNALRAHMWELGMIAPQGRGRVEDIIAAIEDGGGESIPELATAAPKPSAAQLRADEDATAALLLAREMPVLAAARIIEITDHRLWRIVEHDVAEAVSELDLSGLKAFACDETASKKGPNYVTVFIDLDRKRRPAAFATPGKGKQTEAAFKAFREAHGGKADRVAEVVCDMSPAFPAALGEHFTNASQTVDWFHVVQLLTWAVDDVRKMEAKQVRLPKAVRRAVLKAADGALTDKQAAALAELEAGDFLTAEAWRIKSQPPGSTSNASSNVGHQPTATPASKPSTAASRPPERGPEDTGTPGPS